MSAMINDDELYLTINEVAKQIGVVPATIRNWERQGLFTAKRSSSGYRIYNVNDIERLRTIKQRSKDENMGINAIRILYGGSTKGLYNDSANSENVLVSKKLLGQKWKEYRIGKGYNLEDVAKAVGISTSYLSKIENAQANVSYEVLDKLADFYGENIMYYVSDAEEENHLVRKDCGEDFSIGIEGMSIESLIAQKKHTLSAMIYSVKPGIGRLTPSDHSGEEFIHILTGRIKMTLGDTDYSLQVGDSLSFGSHIEHSWYNDGKKPAKIMWVYTPLVHE